MPRFYEEAAHLLLRMMIAGVLIKPGIDNRDILVFLSVRLDQFLTKRPTHADAAIAVLDELVATGMASFDTSKRKRLIALAGTMIGDFLTMRRPAP